MKRNSKAILLVVLFIITLLAYLNLGYALRSRREYQVVIGGPVPTSFKKITHELSASKIIKSYNFFYATAVLAGFDRKLQKGVYTFNNRQSTLEILTRLANGESDSADILVKEGYDLYEIGGELVRLELAETAEDFVRLMRREDVLAKIRERFGARGLKSAEGFIYPDTYRLKVGSDPRTLLELALDNFEKNIYPIYTREKQVNDLLYYLKSASIIEKEASLEKERPLVADVIYNHLGTGDKIRSCATLIYALKVKGLYEQNLRNGVIDLKKKHFTLNSRFNTYLYKGMPLAPICNPSVSSFRAAIKPAGTDYMFFVSKDDGTKEHAFSRTYKEHLRNVDIYQLKKLPAP